MNLITSDMLKISKSHVTVELTFKIRYFRFCQPTFTTFLWKAKPPLYPTKRTRLQEGWPTSTFLCPKAFNVASVTLPI